MPIIGRSTLARFTRIKLPIARDEDLLVEHVGDETVVYDNRTKQAHCLSPLAAVVFDHCDGRTTVDELAGLSAERIGEPVDAARVTDALSQLEERELLAVSPRLAVPSHDRDGLSRRQMIGKTAAAAGGVAFGAPLITSIIAPGAAAAQTTSCGENLCCPCCTAQFGAVQCCRDEVVTNCQCVNASNSDTQPKWCKDSASSAVSDDDCLELGKTATSCGKPCGCNACHPEITCDTPDTTHDPCLCPPEP